MALPINHLKKTLDRCCGQWEFEHHDESRQVSPWTAVVVNLRTSIKYQCRYIPKTQKWEVGSATRQDESFLADRLNGLTRTDAGELPADFDCVPGVE